MVGWVPVVALYDKGLMWKMRAGPLISVWLNTCNIEWDPRMATREEKGGRGNRGGWRGEGGGGGVEVLCHLDNGVQGT